MWEITECPSWTHCRLSNGTQIHILTHSSSSGLFSEVLLCVRQHTPNLQIAYLLCALWNPACMAAYGRETSIHISLQNAILYLHFISMYRMRAVFTTNTFHPCCGLVLGRTLMPKLFWANLRRELVGILIPIQIGYHTLTDTAPSSMAASVSSCVGVGRW